MEKKLYPKNRKASLLLLVFLLFFITSFSQNTIKGVVKDALTQQPLQSVSVYFKGGKGVTSGADGTFTLINYNTKATVINFSYVGYKTFSKTVLPNTDQVIDVALQVAEGNTVTVKTKKRGKYSNRNNPAVELIRHVIDNKDKNKVSSYDFVQYELYEKMELSLTNKPEKLLNNKLFKNYRFILENQDTTTMEGKALLPVYLEEKISQNYFRKNPEKTKTYLLANKRVNFGDYVDNKGISSYLNRMYENVDVYQNNIALLSNQFLSPIADMAPTFYRFYIRDTVEREGVKLVRLTFSPKNLNDLLFRGTIFVTLDGNYSVQKINMSISKHANLNWIRQLSINQDFEKASDGRFHVIMSNTMAEFALTRSASGGVMGQRTVSYKNFTINQPANDSVYEGEALVQVNNTVNSSDSFWAQHRTPPLSETESKVYTNTDSLLNMRSYKRFMDIATLVLAGYKSAGPYEVGPVSAFYSFNSVEGFRLRVGGRSTPKFSKSIYLENYVAYGFKDEKFKYYLSGAYSFNHQSVYAYPLNYIKLGFQHDTKIPGQELQFVQEDNFLLSFKRGTNDKWLYNDIFKAEYVREFAKGLSYNIGFKNWKQTPAGSIVYTKVKGTEEMNIPDVTTSELSAELRWAPREQFYQGKVYRIPIINKYPVLKLRYISGIKGLMNGEYNYQNINLNIQKRFYLSQLGYTDVTTEGGYIFGKVPFSLLSIHRANQTYSYQLNSYNLMNFMEFVSDRYASVNADHYFNGFFFNKIPLLKKLKLREIIAAKVLWGGVRDGNNPAINNDLFKFPVDAKTGLPTTYSLSGTPYVEVSAAVSNIFKLVRVDLVKRLTYTNHPDISKWGIRTMLKFDF